MVNSHVNDNNDGKMIYWDGVGLQIGDMRVIENLFDCKCYKVKCMVCGREFKLPKRFTHNKMYISHIFACIVNRTTSKLK